MSRQPTRARCGYNRYSIGLTRFVPAIDIFRFEVPPIGVAFFIATVLIQITVWRAVRTQPKPPSDEGGGKNL